MRGNPLKAYVSDEQFQLLWENGFLNERAIRDYYIRQKFSKLKEATRPKVIIDQLQREFAYLSHETIRKIVYSKEAELEELQYD